MTTQHHAQSRPASTGESPDAENLRARVERFRRRAAQAMALALGLRWFAIWAVGLGCLVLVLRAGLGWGEASTSGVASAATPGLLGPLGWLLIGLGGVPLLALVAWAVAWRRRPSAASVRALLDQHHAQGGLWMASEEHALGAWHDQLPATTDDDPRPRWTDRRAVGHVALALVFLLASGWLPARRSAEPQRSLAVGERLATLEEQVEVLAEESLIEEPAREELEQALETVGQEASATDPARTWESLDHLEESLEHRANEGVEAATAAGQQLAAMDRVAEQLAAEAEALGQDPEPGVLAELQAMTAEAAANDRLLGDRLARELAEAAGNLGGAESFDRLRAALGDGLGELGDTLERLREAGLIDLEALQNAERVFAGRDDRELVEFLSQNGHSQSAAMCEGSGLGEGQQAGRGGTSRGPGHAPLALDGNPNPEGVELRPEVLPPDAIAALEQSRLLGVSVAAPGAEPRADSTGGALDGADAATGGAHTQVILPQHRRAVERFFERTEGDDG